MAQLKKADPQHQLLRDVARLIEENRQYVAQNVNTTLTLGYYR
jgi:hypothetical protein